MQVAFQAIGKLTTISTDFLCTLDSDINATKLGI